MRILKVLNAVESSTLNNRFFGACKQNTMERKDQ
ncbi:hypothetical protein T09_1880 [Trichinella sp. T9]|nr:hypothetical protein T09_1880 [Trichinella sp. T9]